MGLIADFHLAMDLWHFAKMVNSSSFVIKVLRNTKMGGLPVGREGSE